MVADASSVWRQDGQGVLKFDIIIGVGPGAKLNGLINIVQYNHEIHWSTLNAQQPLVFPSSRVVERRR